MAKEVAEERGFRRLHAIIDCVWLKKEFEGIRGNWDGKEKRFCFFRLQDHYKRLLGGCRILRITLPYSIDKLCQLTGELVERSGYREDVYIRPLAYKSSEALGVRLHDLEHDFLIVVTTLPPNLDAENGVRSCISSWRRVDDTMIPPRGKICGIYINSALAKTEACDNGFDEAILLTQDGHVSEGSGEKYFSRFRGKTDNSTSVRQHSHGHHQGHGHEVGQK